MRNYCSIRNGVVCLLLFTLVIGCQDGEESQQTIKPKKNGSARIGSRYPVVESELAFMEGYYGITFTNQEVQAIDNQPDPIGIVARVRAALEEFGNVATTQLEEVFRQIERPFRSITEAERQILRGTAYGYRLALFLYVLDEVDATAYSGSTCGDCRANAFKHAYFRVANGWTFNRTISNQLGNAHEGVLTDIASQMDRHNNNQGLLVFDIVGRFEDGDAANEINARMNRGELRYVNNGMLIPTNQ